MEATTDSIHDAITAAGCGYDDATGTVADRLRQCATMPAKGADGDYTDAERASFLAAAEAWEASR
jgi:hypothetical protein